MNDFIKLAGILLLTLAPGAAQSQAKRPVIAVFAHPDDERVVAPLLSRLAREGRETHLVIATDGAKGVRDFAQIPAGPELAAARAKEAACAATRLGAKLHMLGLPDAGLASFDALGKLRTALVAVIDSIKPAAIITFGPEGGTGHPDHRLVGNVVTQIVQGDSRYVTTLDLLYVSLPAERLRTAPRASPTINGMAESLLTVRVPFEERDIVAGREEFACHKTQYSPAEMDALNRYLAHAWNGTVWMRPWTGVLRDSTVFKR
jgi:LmbE family N-acetylglucosaminyl deacetylase